jgi:putative sterol carrier protein
VRLQFRLTGDGGGDWWVQIRGTEASRHAGLVDEPDATLEAAAVDWHAVQSGDLDRLQAFMDGKLRISGDLTLFMLHETTITRLSQET